MASMSCHQPSPHHSTSTSSPNYYSYIVIGGGVAAITCAETLVTMMSDNIEGKVLLLVATSTIKRVVDVKSITKTLDEFNVVEQEANEYGEVTSERRLVVLCDAAMRVDGCTRTVYTASGASFSYGRLCVATGARPHVALDIVSSKSPHVMVLRDTESAVKLQEKLANARRVVIVGSGGIALELIHIIQECQLIWILRQDHVGSSFFDIGAATFFEPMIQRGASDDDVSTRFPENNLSDTSALGPCWNSRFKMCGETSGNEATTDKDFRRVIIEQECTVVSIEDSVKQDNCSRNASWPVTVNLSNNKRYGCDFVICATGVVPNSEFLDGKLSLASDGGILVDSLMRTSIPGIYAAGDVCSADWDTQGQWFQMKLWTQARQMGGYAAHCMLAQDVDAEKNVEFYRNPFSLFAHVTRFFGFKVVLLGCYNGQGLPRNSYSLLVRVTAGVEYAKVVLGSDGRIEGALLIGDTGLEETFENLILNRLDLSSYSDQLLDPSIDIEDYFD